MIPKNNGSGSDSGSGGIVHYANGKKVQHVAVAAPPPPPQTMSATPMQQGTTPQQTQAAQAAPPSDQANQAPSNAPPTPPSPQDAHAAMDQNAQAAHGHVASGPQQAVPPTPPNGKPKAKGKVPPQFAKKG